VHFLEEGAFDRLLGSRDILMRRGQHGSLGRQGLRRNSGEGWQPGRQSPSESGLTGPVLGSHMATALGPRTWGLLNEESQPGPVGLGARSSRRPDRGMATDLHLTQGPGCTPCPELLPRPRELPTLSSDGTVGQLILRPPLLPHDGERQVPQEPRETGYLRVRGSPLCLHCSSPGSLGQSHRPLSSSSLPRISAAHLFSGEHGGPGRWPALQALK